MLGGFIFFGTEIALGRGKNRNLNHIADKAKPRAIVGRKATGPSGIAELPKQKDFVGPWS